MGDTYGQCADCGCYKPVGAYRTVNQEGRSTQLNTICTTCFSGYSAIKQDNSSVADIGAAFTESMAERLTEAAQKLNAEIEAVWHACGESIEIKPWTRFNIEERTAGVWVEVVQGRRIIGRD